MILITDQSPPLEVSECTSNEIEMESKRDLSKSGTLTGNREESFVLPASGMQTLFSRMQTADSSSRDFLVVTGFRISGSLQVVLLGKSFEAVVIRQRLGCRVNRLRAASKDTVTRSM